MIRYEGLETVADVLGRLRDEIEKHRSESGSNHSKRWQLSSYIVRIEYALQHVRALINHVPS